MVFRFPKVQRQGLEHVAQVFYFQTIDKNLNSCVSTNRHILLDIFESYTPFHSTLVHCFVLISGYLWVGQSLPQNSCLWLCIDFRVLLSRALPTRSRLLLVLRWFQGIFKLGPTFHSLLFFIYFLMLSSGYFWVEHSQQITVGFCSVLNSGCLWVVPSLP